MLELDLVFIVPALLGFLGSLGFGLGGTSTKSGQSADVQPLGGYTPEIRRLTSNLLTQDYFPLAREAANAPFGTFRGQDWRSLTPSGQFGLMPEAEAGVSGMIRQALSRVSGSEASRGFVSPENIPNVAGSSIQNILPQLLPMIQAYQQFRMMLPEQLYGSRLGFLEQPIQMATPLVGSQTSAAGKSSTFGWNLSGTAGTSPGPAPKSAT